MHLKVGLNNLKENKFIHNIQYSIDPLSSFINSVESTILFFHHCANYTFQKQTLLNKMRSVDSNIVSRKKRQFIKRSYLENRILNIHLIKRLFKLPSASYYQQSVLFALYFKLTYLLWYFNVFFLFPFFFYSLFVYYLFFNYNFIF